MLRDYIHPKWTVPSNMSQMVAFASGFSSPLYDPSSFTNEQDGTQRCVIMGGGWIVHIHSLEAQLTKSLFPLTFYLTRTPPGMSGKAGQNRSSGSKITNGRKPAKCVVVGGGDI